MAKLKLDLHPIARNGAAIEHHRDRHLFGQSAVHRHRAAARDRQARQTA